MENPKITNTPYDDVFRTLLNDCSPTDHPGDQRSVRGALFRTREDHFLPERAFPEPAGRE